MATSSFNFDDTGLRNLIKALDGDHIVRVGIFGSQHTAPTRRLAGAKRKNYEVTGRQIGKGAAGMTNAEVGYLAEVGSPSRGTPARPWLAMTIRTKINEIVKDSAKYFTEAVKTGDAIKFMTIIGINAEKWIGLAFDTKGFGSWAPNAPSTIARKGSSSPLIDTSQLRRSVTSMVV